MSIKAVFLSLLALSGAVSVPQTDYDVIIVGGGPAGLSALSGVARVRRNALLFDNQQYRNGPTREMHDVIGNDGELYPAILKRLFTDSLIDIKQAPHLRLSEVWLVNRSRSTTPLTSRMRPWNLLFLLTLISLLST